MYTSISLYRAFPSTLLSNVGLPLPVSLFLRNRGGLVNDFTLSRAFLSTRTQTLGEGRHTIGAKPNLYCEAIQLVCGGSPIGCGLVERKAQLRGKQEGQQPKPVINSCLYSTSVQSWMKSMGTICSSHFSLYRAFLSTRSTILGEPPPVSLLSWSRGGLVIAPHTSSIASQQRLGLAPMTQATVPLM